MGYTTCPLSAGSTANALMSQSRRPVLRIHWGVVLMAIAAGTTNAATFCVSDATTLREVLRTAATNGRADVIQLEQGVYLGGFAYTSDANKAMEGTVTLEGGYQRGCSSRVLSQSNTVLDGRSRQRTLRLTGRHGEDFTLEGITIRNGQTQGPGGGLYVSTAGAFSMEQTGVDGSTARDGKQPGQGGGIYAKADTVEILAHSRITDNRADDDGGGLYADTRVLTVMDSRILDNSTRTEGGGIRAKSREALLEDNYLFDNSATGRGGGVHIDYGDQYTRDVTFARNWVLRNVAGTDGGGISIQTVGTDAVFRKNQIRDNRAQRDGGGLYVDGYGSSGDASGTFQAADRSGNVLVADNGMRNNRAAIDGAGAVLRELRQAELVGNLITYNNAGDDGGGVWLFSVDDVVIVSNTTAYNDADDDGGAFFVRFATDLGVYNTVGQENDARSPLGGDFVNSVHSVANVQRSMNNAYDCCWAYPALQLDEDGRRSVYSNYFVNEDIGDFRLVAGSRLIDVGSNTVPSLPTWDHDGARRVYNSVTDIGAFEYPGLTASPSVGAVPTTVPFGRIAVGDSLTHTVSLANNGGAPLVVQGITLSDPGTWAKVTDDCSWRTLAPSVNCIVEVALRPLGVGDHTASLTVNSSDPSYPQYHVQLDGVATDEVGGGSTAMSNVRVACQNRTAGRRKTVRFTPTTVSWNCEERGLRVERGDAVRVIVDGKAR